jgi:long-chain acyl-CoA synthetase
MSLLIPSVKPGYFGQGSVEVGPSAAQGEGPSRRLAITCGALITQPLEGVNTVTDVLEHAARTHGKKNAVGWRDIVKIHEEKKEVKKVVNGKEVREEKVWKYFELSDYKYLSYLEMEERVSEVARALLDLGFASDGVFNIYAQTR